MSGANKNSFSKLSEEQKISCMVKLAEAFEASAHDLGALFTTFLETSNIGHEASNEAIESVTKITKESASETDQYLDALVSSIQQLHSSPSTNDRERLRIMSLIAPLFPRAELLRRGFRVSNDAFANARKHAANLGPGSPVASGGRPKIYTAQVAQIIEEFCCLPDNSYESDVDAYGNHISNGHHPQGMTRILNKPISSIFQLFSTYHPEMHVTYQAFRSMIPSYIGKRPRELTEDELEYDQTPKKKRGRPSKGSDLSDSLNQSNTILNTPEQFNNTDTNKN